MTVDVQNKNHIFFFDFEKKVNIFEITNINGNLKNIKAKKDMFLIHLDSNIYIYSFPQITCKLKLETFSSELEPLTLSSNENSYIMACKSDINSVKICVNFLGNHKLKGIKNAHNEEISCLNLNRDGSLLASCSTNVLII